MSKRGLRSDVLVLNRGWFPVQITTVRHAFGRLCSGAMKVIQPETLRPMDLEEWKTVPVDVNSLDLGPDYINHGRSIPILVPRVVVLTRFDRLPPRYVTYSRDGVFERDNFTCQYCGAYFDGRYKSRSGERLLNIDHVIPKSHPKYPGTNFKNCVTACIPCNNLKKQNKTPEEAGMTLLKQPSIPNWKPITMGTVKRPHPMWKNFLVGEEV